MRNREDLLQELLGVAVNSYASYVLKAAAMPCYDEADKKLLALFKEVGQREQSYAERAYDAVFAAGLRPAPQGAALHFAQLNFCRPFQVASRWALESRREAEVCQGLLSEFKLSGPTGLNTQACRLCEDMIVLKDESARLVDAKLAEVRPKVAPVVAGSAPKAAGGAPTVGAGASMPPPPGVAGMPKAPSAGMPKPPGAPAMPSPPGAPAMPKAPAVAMPKPPGAPSMPKPPTMPPPPR